MIALLLPNETLMSEREALTGIKFGVAEWGEPRHRYAHGIQVFDPKLSDWNEHARIIEGYGFTMIKPVAVCRVSEIADWILHDPDRVPMLLLRDAPWRPHLNLKRHMWRLTKVEHDGN